jgi:hypothetical protein
MTALATATPQGRLVAVLAFVLGLGLLGQALGLAAGALLHARLPGVNAIQRSDRIAGAAVGGFGVVILLWLILPALTSAPGWTARAAQGSQIASTIEQVAPDPPKSLRELGRMVAEEPFPQVFSPDDGPADVGTPPPAVLPAAVDARVRAAIVRVEGRACDQIQDRTGFVPSGQASWPPTPTSWRGPNVRVPPERRQACGSGWCSTRRDPRDPGRRQLRLAPLSIGEGQAGSWAVYGHPAAATSAARPGSPRRSTRGTDIYRTTPTSRDVFVLAAQLAPGDSGAHARRSGGPRRGHRSRSTRAAKRHRVRVDERRARARALRRLRRHRRNGLLPGRLTLHPLAQAEPAEDGRHEHDDGERGDREHTDEGEDLHLRPTDRVADDTRPVREDVEQEQDDRGDEPVQHLHPDQEVDQVHRDGATPRR